MAHISQKKFVYPARMVCYKRLYLWVIEFLQVVWSNEQEVSVFLAPVSGLLPSIFLSEYQLTNDAFKMSNTEIIM